MNGKKYTLAAHMLTAKIVSKELCKLSLYGAIKNLDRCSNRLNIRRDNNTIFFVLSLLFLSKKNSPTIIPMPANKNIKYGKLKNSTLMSLSLYFVLYVFKYLSVNKITQNSITVNYKMQIRARTCNSFVINKVLRYNSIIT